MENSNSKYLFYYLLYFLIYLVGCQKDDILSPANNNYTRDFDSVWTTFDRNYPLFDYKGISWDNSYEQYKNKFNNISIDERNSLLANMLGIFKDPHINITTTSGNIILTYVPSNFTINYNTNYLNKFVNSFVWHKENDTWGWGNINSIGYLRITSFSSTDLDTVAFGDVIDSLITTTGLILDIRQEPGGNLLVINNIWNRFASETRVVGYQLYRSGINHNTYAGEIPLISRPQGAFQYLKEVVILIGQQCASAGEIFAKTMSLNNNVILIGDTTLGAVEAPSDYMLSDGAKYSVPIVAYLDLNHKPLEWNGVSPNIYYDPLIVRNNSERDILIEKAFDIINSTKSNIKNSRSMFANKMRRYY